MTRCRGATRLKTDAAHQLQHRLVVHALHAQLLLDQLAQLGVADSQLVALLQRRHAP
jgi:hypothetical protein